MRSNIQPSKVLIIIVGLLLLASPGFAIMAGDEFALPEDSPSQRIDTLGAASPFNFAGALEITDDTQNYNGIGSASALSPHWALTAGHNADIDDDGQVDADIDITFHLPGYSSYNASQITINPDFDGFGNPSIHNDLALLYFDNPLPEELFFPSLGISLQAGDEIKLAGFGKSGYGDYGYTTDASLTDRRTGANIIDSLEYQSDGDGILFRYDFDAPDSQGEPGGSLGNDIETIIGPGDSGGPVFREYGSGHALLGVSTFTEGYGGQFGDNGGGTDLDPHWTWISDTTGLPLIPEPGSVWLVLTGFAVLWTKRLRHAVRQGKLQG